MEMDTEEVIRIHNEQLRSPNTHITLSIQEEVILVFEMLGPPKIYDILSKKQIFGES